MKSYVWIIQENQFKLREQHGISVKPLEEIEKSVLLTVGPAKNIGENVKVLGERKESSTGRRRRDYCVIG